jgi:regulator of sigma E protease
MLRGAAKGIQVGPGLLPSADASDSLVTSIAQIFAVVFGLSFLVIVHEAGHYLVARAYGMRVLRFSIGLGPPIAKWQPKGSPTVFQVAAIPFLAYVQIDGMNPFEEIDKNDPALFPNKSATARFATLFAGSAFNYIAASILVFVMVAIGGMDRENVAVVGEVTEGLPAAEAGLRSGDIIEMANGVAMHSITDVSRMARDRVDVPTELSVRRGEALITLTVTPRLVPVEGADPQPRIGIVMGHLYEPVSLGEAAGIGIVGPALAVVDQIRGITQLILHPRSDGLQSVVDMGAIMAETVERGWRDYIGLLAGISIALAVFNLLPIPALDGGRIMFVLYEAITRRRPNEKFEAVVHTVGLLLLLGLVLVVNARSIYVRWIAPDEPTVTDPATARPLVPEPAEDPATAPSEPAIEAPAVEAPAIEAPTIEAPAVEAPATEPVEAPAIEAPAIEAPAIEAPAPEVSP